MKGRINIIIADDYPMFREGIQLLLEQEKDIVIVGEASNGNELIKIAGETQPDVIITDIEMPVVNGIEATKDITDKFPQIKVIALTMFGDEHLIVDMLEAGAKGYLLKNTKKAELTEAIKIVHEGGIYFCNGTSMKLSKMIARTKIGGKNKEVQFSEKETEIIKLICEQYASKQIASMTNLTERTVEKYRDHIMRKTGAINVVGIVIYAIRKGIFKP